jgi:hypothetical protein
MSLTSEDLQALRSEFATKDDLRTELTRFATKDDLQRELTRFATNDDLRIGLAGLRAEIGVLREETALAFADQRRYMEILHEDLTSRMQLLFDGLAARIEAVDGRHSSRSEHHEARIGGLERRVTVLETKRPKRR